MKRQSKSILISLIIQFCALQLFTTPIAKVIGWSLWVAELIMLILTFRRELEESKQLT